MNEVGLRGERSGQTSYIFVTNSLNSDQPCTCTDPYMNTHRTGGEMKRALPAAVNQSQQWPMQKTCRLVFLSYLDEHHEHSKSSFFAILLLFKAEARSQPQLCQFSSTTNFTFDWCILTVPCCRTTDYLFGGPMIVTTCFGALILVPATSQRCVGVDELPAR